MSPEAIIIIESQGKRKAYTKPDVIHELELETKAGSTINLPVPPLDDFEP